MFVCECKIAKPNIRTTPCGVSIMWKMVDQSSNLKSEIDFDPPGQYPELHVYNTREHNELLERERITTEKRWKS